MIFDPSICPHPFTLAIIRERGQSRSHRSFVRYAVRAVMLRNGKFLMVHSSTAGDYKFPGGSVKPGESHEQALARELREETGRLLKQVITLLGVAIIGLIRAVGTSLVYGLGGYLVIKDAFTIGSIVAFGAYLGSLYGVLQELSNVLVEFSMSVVSFERVFEVLDLPLDIEEKPKAIQLDKVKGDIVFEKVSF